jgi:hypothetical protein
VLLGHIGFLFFNFTVCLTFLGNRIVITVGVSISSPLPSVTTQFGGYN